MIQTLRMEMPRLGTRKLYYLLKELFEFREYKNRARCFVWLFKERKYVNKTEEKLYKENKFKTLVKEISQFIQDNGIEKTGRSIC